MTVSGRVALRLVSVCLAASTALASAAHAADPVTLNIVDVAGDLQLTQKGFEAFKAKYPNLVANLTFTNAPAPQLPGKIKAMQAAGRSDIDPAPTHWPPGSNRISG
jgi:putative spermidine/putrescine transport system substrate-binding protein